VRQVVTVSGTAIAASLTLTTRILLALYPARRTARRSTRPPRLRTADTANRHATPATGHKPAGAPATTPAAPHLIIDHLTT
jgi:hypothetical protein